MVGPRDDLLEMFVIDRVTFPNGTTRVEIVPKQGTQFEPAFFTRLQLDIMERLAHKYFAYTADEMSDDSHQDSGIWHQVWEVEARQKGEIPYDYALLRKGSEADLALLEHAREREAIFRSFRKR